MTLAELIARLEAANPQQVVTRGFDSPHSYRGDYMDLAFEPATDITVADMLDAARSALGETFTDYKGGDFTMDGYTDCWLAEYGCLGETIGPLLLDLMLAAPAVPAGQAPDTGPRQPAYDAVYAYIGSTNRVPGDLVTRNAMIWRAVNAALDAVLPAPAECTQCGDAGACNGGPCPLAPAVVSAVPGQADGETTWGVCPDCRAAAGPDCDCPPSDAEQPAARAQQTETCTNCRGSGLDPRYNGEFACPDCAGAAGAQQPKEARP